MSDASSKVGLARRSFLSRIGLSGAAFGAIMGARPADAQTPAGTSQPARHSEDDWFDQPNAKHRLFIDTTSAEALGNAMLYTNNFFTGNRNGYGLTDQDSAVIVCLRHESAPFAFSDAMWTKYSAALTEHAHFNDPKTKQPATINIYMASGYNALLPSRGITLDANIKRGLRLAVCQLATRAIATAAARATGAKADDVFKELVDNRLPNSQIVPAGIVAVNRAQERGYTFAYVNR